MVDGLPKLNAASTSWTLVAAPATPSTMARVPNSRFTGYDFSEEGIARPRRGGGVGLKNASFEMKDAATLDGRSS
jgi:hypothetical protein